MSRAGDAPDVAAIAAGLTKAQREALVAAQHRDAAAYGVSGFEPFGRSLSSLKKRGLAASKVWRSATGRSRVGVILTPLGLAVRHHLEQHP